MAHRVLNPTGAVFNLIRRVLNTTRRALSLNRRVFWEANQVCNSTCQVFDLKGDVTVVGKQQIS
ncbi:MAG: hypothetical protein KME16_14595 [Scytolyngbya sp. HA4215-MV1]|nr:hypothetical protein [Scytolyngbya sp. HA4215-MV1]